MIKFIIKTNEWYEKLPGIKGDLFYLSLLIIPYITLLITIPMIYHGKYTQVFSPMIAITWPLLVGLWRLSYSIIIDLKKRKETKC